MELRHLRYFVAVAEEGHVTRAAERLGIQQPPLSQQIKALERELNVQLFRRKPRGVELTDAGRAILDIAAEIFRRLESAPETARRAARGQIGRITIGIASTAYFVPLIPKSIRRFREQFPEVEISLREGGTSDLVQQTQAGAVDVALVRKVFASTRSLIVNHLLNEPMAVAVPTGHHLSRSKSGKDVPVALKSLSDERFVLYRRQEGPGLTDVIMSACQAVGFVPRFGQEAPRPSSALNFVAAGHGISIVPDSMRRMNLDGVSYRRLSGPLQLRAPLNLVTRVGETSAAVRQFVILMKRILIRGE